MVKYHRAAALIELRPQVCRDRCAVRGKISLAGPIADELCALSWPRRLRPERRRSKKQQG
jgi:hypothetical protein